MNRNLHNVPLDKIVWHRNLADWEFPLKVVIGESDRLMCAKTHRPFLMIANLDNPTKCTFHSHPDNFKTIVDFAKRILLEGKSILETITDE